MEQSFLVMVVYLAYGSQRERGREIERGGVGDRKREGEGERGRERRRERDRQTDRQTDREGEREGEGCLLYTSPSPRDRHRSRMPSSA